MTRLPQLIAMTFLILLFAGCSSTVSQSSPEAVRDPLGIDRAVNDYYFPDETLEPESDGEEQAAGSDAESD